jgi:hypothetical protein
MVPEEASRELAATEVPTEPAVDALPAANEGETREEIEGAPTAEGAAQDAQQQGAEEAGEGAMAPMTEAEASPAAAAATEQQGTKEEGWEVVPDGGPEKQRQGAPLLVTSKRSLPWDKDREAFRNGALHREGWVPPCFWNVWGAPGAPV